MRIRHALYAEDESDLDLQTHDEPAGRSKLESTVRYLGIEVDDALEISEQIEI